MGYDTRFFGREFSLAAAEVLAKNGLTPLLCDRDTPTPVISYTIRNRKAIGGINMTASHNPAEYQGLKFSTSNGAPRHSGGDAANRGEHRALAGSELVDSNPRSSAPSSARQSTRRPAYCKRIEQLVDFAAIRRAKLKVAVEFRYGTGRGYLDTLLEECGREGHPFSMTN